MTRSVLTLDLKDAHRILAAGEKKAAELKRAYNLAVVDAGGNLLAQIRMDGAWVGSVDIALHKAWTARAFDMSTEALGHVAQSGQPGFGINTTNDSHVVIFGGGMPVIVDGAVIGAVGASGSTVEEDLLVVRAAVAGFAA